MQYIKSLNKFSLKKFSSELMVKDSQTGLFIRRQKRQPDRFRFDKVLDLKELFEITQNPRNKLTMNETIIAFNRITELVHEHELKDVIGVDEIYFKIKRVIKDLQMEDPLIGRLARSLYKFSKYKDLETWVQINDYIIQDIWDQEHDEILYALQGFDNLVNKFKKDWQVKLYYQAMEQIEKNLAFSLQQSKYSFDELSLISQLLVDNNRFQNSNLFEEIEFQILKLLKKMDKASDQNDQTILWIQSQLKLFNDLSFVGNQLIKAKFNANLLFDSTMQILLNILIKDDKILTEMKFMVYFMEWWCANSAEFQMNDLIINKIQESIIKFDSQFTLQQINVIHNTLELIDQRQNKLLIDFLENKFLQITDEKIQFTKLQDIQNFIENKALLEYDDNMKDIPQNLFEKLDFIAYKQIMSFNSAELFFFINNLEDKEIINRFPEFIKVLPNLIFKQIDQIEFDDLCYFYVILTLNSEVALQAKFGDSTEFWTNVYTIKSQIKHQSMGRGFKIDLNSHFHKLLNVVDLAEFFEGGEQ